MKRKIISFLLTLALLCSLFPASALTASAYSDTDIAYPVEGGNIYFDKETGAITDCDDSVTRADIPAEIDGVAVTSIGVSAFEYCDSLTSVTIPGSVSSIGGSAFSCCTSLTSVTIPDSVSGIGPWALAQCNSLESVTIGNSVTSIGEFAFFACDRLTDMTIPESVKSIGDNAFNCCIRLMGIWVDEANETYSSNESGILFNKDKTVLIRCPGGYSGSYTIPSSVISIGHGAFDSCYNLTGVTVPGGVTSIDTWAFCDCGSLSAVYFMGAAPTLGSNVFDVYDTETGNYQPIPGLTLYYIEGAEGWTTPTWKGYPTAVWDPNAPEDPEDPPVVFDDVSEDAWYASAVEYAVENGLFNGMSENTFEPDTSMTRVMLVTVLWRYAGEPAEGENIFIDVPAGQWYTDAVAWAAHNGIVGGVGDNKFDPNGNITREQMATILYRYASGQDIDTSARADLSGFPDAGSVSSYANDPICWAVAEGLVNGSDGKLMPQGNATRAQVATILMRFIENVVK